MGEVFFEEEFRGIDFKAKKQFGEEYEHCVFVNCSFATTDCSEITFIDCEFDSCDFSGAKMLNTSFQNAQFKACKLLGLHFEDCNSFLLSMNFEGCQINFSSFYKLSLKQTKFKDCFLEEVDFSESDLTNSIFNTCDLSRAIFENTILEKADFRTSFNFTIDPENNRIKKAKFSVQSLAGLLHNYDIEVE